MARRIISIMEFEPVHLDGFAPRFDQCGEVEAIGRGAIHAAQLGPAFTAFCDEGRGELKILGCAGLIRNHEHYATAWARFADGLSPGEWSALTAAIKRVIEASGLARIDMIVRTGFAAAERYAAHLGFAREGVLHRYGSDGSDFALYARVKERTF